MLQRTALAILLFAPPFSRKAGSATHLVRIFPHEKTFQTAQPPFVIFVYIPVDVPLLSTVHELASSAPIDIQVYCDIRENNKRHWCLDEQIAFRRLHMIFFLMFLEQIASDIEPSKTCSDF